MQQRATTNIRHALMSVYRFGPFGGAQILAKSSTPDGCVALKLNGFRAPVLLRRGSSDWPTFAKVFLDHEYRVDLPNFQPKLIIDAGANVGYASLFFARRYPEARILAIEPEPANYTMLERNTRAYSNIMPIQAALWNSNERLAISNPQADSWSFQVQKASAADPGIQGVTIPELLKLSGQERIDLLKIDIEGAEKELFSQGTEAWLGKVRMLIIELHDRNKPGCSRAFYQALTQYEFGQFPIGENIVVVMQP